ncbi:hypothetical protein AB4Z54_27795 [Streptomyces sp. MCAF7]
MPDAYEVRAAGFHWGFRTVLIDGEPWLLLGDVSRSLHMKRERALELADPDEVKQVHIWMRGWRWSYPAWVISEFGAMDMAPKRVEADRG